MLNLTHIIEVRDEFTGCDGWVHLDSQPGDDWRITDRHTLTGDEMFVDSPASPEIRYAVGLVSDGNLSRVYSAITVEMALTRVKSLIQEIGDEQ